jgi:hypothetical protein
VVAEHAKPGICEGVVVRWIALLDITDKEVVFRDPNFDGSGIHRREYIEHFRKSFESLGSRALARYKGMPNS